MIYLQKGKITDFMKILTSLFLLIFVFSAVTGCSKLDPQQAGTEPVSHQIFDELLMKYVNSEGDVDYKGLKTDRARLKEYLKLLSDNPPNDVQWSREEKLAYWINVYNAFTLELVLEHYPVESIKDIGSKIQIPFVNTPWDIKFIKIGDKEYDLNNIEHNIIRKVFNEPRIHFAVNCASFSCPKLRNEAYTGEKLEKQLNDQTINFLNDSDKNQITQERLSLSKIFSWYGGDFTNGQSKIEFIQQFTEVEISPDAKIDYLEYDWSLNEMKLN
jgi:hypothetical protein